MTGILNGGSRIQDFEYGNWDSEVWDISNRDYEHWDICNLSSEFLNNGNWVLLTLE